MDKLFHVGRTHNRRDSVVGKLGLGDEVCLGAEVRLGEEICLGVEVH